MMQDSVDQGRSRGDWPMHLCVGLLEQRQKTCGQGWCGTGVPRRETVGEEMDEAGVMVVGVGQSGLGCSRWARVQGIVPDSGDFDDKISEMHEL